MTKGMAVHSSEWLSSCVLSPPGAIRDSGRDRSMPSSSPGGTAFSAPAAVLSAAANGTSLSRLAATASATSRSARSRPSDGASTQHRTLGEDRPAGRIEVCAHLRRIDARGPRSPRPAPRPPPRSTGRSRARSATPPGCRPTPRSCSCVIAVRYDGNQARHPCRRRQHQRAARRIPLLRHRRRSAARLGQPP